MQNSSKVEHGRLIIFILGTLSTISPLSIDMYLAAFPQVAADLHTTQARVSLSVSSYFVGLAIGQIFYGPLLDRFGRRIPLYCGLLLYSCASLGCMSVHSVEWLIALRFVQALGGCAAQVASTAMVRDFFPVSQSAKIFSLLMLMIGVSPLLAPSVGTLVSSYLGWRWIFAILSVISLLILSLTALYLPTGHTPDHDVSLHPKRILQSYRKVFMVRQFWIYALAGAFTFAGLFAYVAGSPIVFFNYFNVSPKVYSFIFALLIGGFIGSNQVNIWLHRKFRSQEIFQAGLYAAFAVAIALTLAVITGHGSLHVTIALLFLFLFSVGLTSPNGAALSLAPFSKNAGTASAMLGFLQMGIGAAISSCVGIFGAGTSLPVFCVFVLTTGVAIGILICGKRALPVEVEPNQESASESPAETIV